MVVELLNSYKKSFVQKRYFQTLLGGLNLRIGDGAPFYAYLIQIVIFITPWVIGCCFTLFYEFRIFGSSTPDYVYGIVCGFVVSSFVLAAQLTSALLQQRTSEVRMLPEGAQNNRLSEEEEVEFDSCLSPHVVQYLVPVKKYKVNILLHSSLSCLLCGYGLLYLVPSTVHLLFSSTAITVIWYTLGWMVLCIAQYSLTVRAPPELATFRTTDVFELASLMRPFYVLLFLVVDLLWRYCPALVSKLTLPNQVLHITFITLLVPWSLGFLLPVNPIEMIGRYHEETRYCPELVIQLTLPNQILHIAFISLPVLWSLGFLPPLEALVLWLLEQILVHVFGGSPMATNLRLIVMVSISGCAVLICSFLPSSLPIILFSSLCGYILSLDLSGITSYALEVMNTKRRSTDETRNTTSDDLDDGLVVTLHGSHWVLVVLRHVVLLAVTTGVAIGTYFYSSSVSFGAWQALGITVLVGAKAETWLRQFQQVYMFGIFRNCLYPREVHSIDKFMGKKRRIKHIARGHKLLMNFVMPVLLVVYVTLGTSLSPTTPPSFLLAVGSIRAFRWIWQSTSNSLLELSVVHFVNFFIQPSPTSTWATIGLGPQLMIAGFARDRLFQVLHKLYTYLTILVTSYTFKKQRRSTSVPLLVASVLLFPLTLLIIVVAAALSAPLLPLFTLPILLIGFPRPVRSWPGAVGGSASTCDDTAYYKEMIPQLVTAFQTALSSGSLGFPQPGYHYIVRFQDRMAWVQVLECGFGYYSLSIKGMELQETSCHTVEALELEAQFHRSFETGDEECCSPNRYLAHTMTPMDVLTFRTYSDAKSTLTGIIDSNHMMQTIDGAFCKTLVWVLVKHVLETKDYSLQKAALESSQGKEANKTTSVLNEEIKQLQSNLSVPQEQGVNLDKVSESQATCPSKDSGHPESLLSRPHSIISFERKRSLSWSSLGSFDGGGFKLDTIHQKKQDAEVGLDVEDDVFGDLPGSVRAEEDDLLKELQFGLPVADTGTPKHLPQAGIKLANSIQFSSTHSSKLSLPFKWREIPIDQSEVVPLLGRYPTGWFRSVLLHQLGLTEDDRSSEEVVDEMMADSALTEMYSYLTMACYLVACGNNLMEGGKTGPAHVYRTYSGDLPWSPHLEWLSEDEELFSIVKQAFRLAFKLAYDQMILGEGEEDEDLISNLEDYEANWYFGRENDGGWKEAVIQRKPQLFSLMFNAAENTYHGRVLSHQPVAAYVGSLNQEMVRALWASLSLEMLYMTNDDEERYSIQAHPVILRNLTVQAADPPLGYPIYASPPISVPTL